MLCTLFRMNYVVLYPSSSTFTLSPSPFHLFSQWLPLPLPHIRMAASAGLAIDVFQAKSSPIPIFQLLRLSLYHCSSLFRELQRSLVNCSPCSWWYLSFPLRCVAGVCLFVLAYVAEVFYGVVPPCGSYYRVVFCGLGWLCVPCVRVISDVGGRGKTT